LLVKLNRPGRRTGVAADPDAKLEAVRGSRRGYKLAARRGHPAIGSSGVDANVEDVGAGGDSPKLRAIHGDRGYRRTIGRVQRLSRQYGGGRGRRDATDVPFTEGVNGGCRWCRSEDHKS